MTKQERADNAELIQEAKSLGIKSPHMCGLENLKVKVADAGKEFRAEFTPVETVVIEEVVEPVAPIMEPVVKAPVAKVAKRKPPPKMNVNNINEDSRAKLIHKLEAEYPGETFLFQSSETSDEQLLAKGMERTEFRLGNDIIARTDMKSYEDRISAMNESDRRSMDAIDDEGLEIQSLTIAPKKGRT